MDHRVSRAREVACPKWIACIPYYPRPERNLVFRPANREYLVSFDQQAASQGGADETCAASQQNAHARAGSDFLSTETKAVNDRPICRTNMCSSRLCSQPQ